MKMYRVIQLLLPLLASCGSLQSTPTQHGDWGWMRPTEDSVWIHEPGLPYYDAYSTTIKYWKEASLGDCGPLRRVAVTEHDGPIDVWGMQANGLVASSTRKRASIHIRGDLAPAVRERLVIHEMVHVCGGRDNVGMDRRHSDPVRWNPSLTSVEARATCELQDMRCANPETTPVAYNRRNSWSYFF